jgi:hypothetical protein
MANEEVLRLRATVVSEEALANIRAIGREIGIVQQKGGAGAKNANSSWGQLAKTIKAVGGETLGAVTGLSGLGAAGLGAAAGFGIVAAAGYKLVSGLGDLSKKIIDLNNASKELGMGTDALKAFATEAKKAGIAPEAMMQGLASFKRNTEDFGMRIGELRGQMVAMGAGPVLARINSATKQIDKLKEAYDFKEVLMEADPSGMKARRFFEMMGLGADATRLSWDELSKTMKEKELLTPEQVQAAKDYNASLIKMGETWDALTMKLGVKLFPMVGKDLADLNGILEALGKFDAWVDSWLGKGVAADPVGAAVGKLNQWTGLDKWDPFGWKAERDQKENGPEALQKGLQDRARQMREQQQTAPGRAAGGPVFQGLAYTVGENGPETFVPGATGAIAPRADGTPIGNAFAANARGTSGGDDSGASRIIQVGVFDALVQFKSYIEAGGALGGAGGGGGIMRASLGGGTSGGYSGPGGGTGGGGYGGGATGGGADTSAPADTGNGQSSSRPGPGGQNANVPDTSGDPNAPPASFNDRWNALGGGAAGGPSGANAPSGGASSGGRVTAKDQNNKVATVKAAIKEQLLSQGASERSAEVGANVLTGQAMAESGLKSQFHDAGIRKGRAGGYVPSIYGADKARGQAMTAWLAKNKLPDTPENQGRWMAHEAWTKYPKTRAAIETGNQDHAADVATKNFEGPQDQGERQLRTRRNFANQAAAAQTTTESGPNGQATATPNTKVASVNPNDGVGLQPNGQSNQVATGNRLLPGRDLRGTDPRIKEIVTAAAEGLPEGYKIQPTSGVRTAGQGQHTHGRAVDWQIIGPDGKAISNRGDDSTGLYTKLAQNAYGYQEKYHKDLTGKFQWGGQFGTSSKNPNEPDLMHFDTGGRRGRISRYSRERIGATLPPMPGQQPNGQSTRVASNDPNFVPQAPIQHADLQQKLIEEGKRRALLEEGKKREEATRRIDETVGAQSVNGNVSVTVNSNGTKADAKVAEKGDLYQKSSVTQHKQMQKTEEAPASFNDRFAGAEK